MTLQDSPSSSSSSWRSWAWRCSPARSAAAAAEETTEIKTRSSEGLFKPADCGLLKAPGGLSEMYRGAEERGMEFGVWGDQCYEYLPSPERQFLTNNSLQKLLWGRRGNLQNYSISQYITFIIYLFDIYIYIIPLCIQFYLTELSRNLPQTPLKLNTQYTSQKCSYSIDR